VQQGRGETGVRRLIWRLLFWTYVPLAALSILVIPLGAIGLVRNDPFMTVLALVLGIPWSILFPWWIDTSSAFLNFVLLILALGINGLILRYLSKRRPRDPEPPEDEPEDNEEMHEPETEPWQ
jgi:hypothetical protein